MTRTHDVVRARSKSALSCSFFNPRSFSHQATEKPSCAAGRALPPSRDRSQGHLVSSRTSKPERRPQQSAGIIQATPSKHIHSTSRSHSPPNVGGKTDIPTKPFHQARSNRKTSRILENKRAQTTPTTECKHHPSKPIQAHQLDIPHSLPTRRKGSVIRPNPSNNHEAIASHLVLSRASKPGRRPQQGASII